MLKNTYKLKDTIDVFVSEIESTDKVLIIFHKMTTRERIEIVAGKGVAELIALLDGQTTITDILKALGEFDENSASKLIDFLSQQHVITDTTCQFQHDQRYMRQVAYFDDLVLDRPGNETQSLLESKKIVALGCGAVGGGIVEILARAGVNSFVLVDYKRITAGNYSKDLYSTLSDIGKYKVEVLADFLRTINPGIKIITHREALIPNTELNKWIPIDSDLVINSCDEPYIGHTSLKIGRYLHELNIPMYVAGGFDSHLMSSGELIFPPHTPCIDCAQQTFTKALGDWKPIYTGGAIVDGTLATSELYDLNNYVAGGPGGAGPLSGFSANFAAMRILQFLADSSAFDFKAIRHEYLVNSGVTTQFQMIKQERCVVCNS